MRWLTLACLAALLALTWGSNAAAPAASGAGGAALEPAPRPGPAAPLARPPAPRPAPSPLAPALAPPAPASAIWAAPPAPVPPPPPPAPPPWTLALQAELEAMAAGWGGENAVSVLDLESGALVSVNGGRPQLAACTIKIPIMIAVAQDVEAGRYSRDDVAGLVQSAMGPSNTWPARELLAVIGGGDIGAGVRRANQIMWDAGAAGSIMTHPPGYYWEEYGYAAERGAVDNLITSDDMALLLARLYRGEALGPEATAYALWSLTIAPDWMDASLGAPLPPDARLYHKVGQLYGPHNTWNDAGLVELERGGRRYAYAIAYLGSWGGSWEEHYARAQAASAAAWRHFSAAHGL